MFILESNISLSTFESVKRDLERELPDVQSAHRCEALARGLGFGSMAALRAGLKASASLDVQTDGETFVRYLSSKGIVGDARSLHRAVARHALRTIMEKLPKLTDNGWGWGDPPRNEQGRFAGHEEWKRQFEARRAELLSDGATDKFLACLSLLRLIPQTKTFSGGIGSYRMKHIAENFRCTFPEGERLGPLYVSNGIMIAAAVHSGFRMKSHLTPSGHDQINVSLNMPKRIVDELDAEIRPTSAAGQIKREKLFEQKRKAELTDFIRQHKLETRNRLRV